MNLQENVNRIKQVMGLITEETIEDLRKILASKFPKHNWNEKIIERQGENIITKGFSKVKNGNFVSAYNPADDFYVVEYVDGPNKGLKLKRYASEDKEDETVADSPLQIKYKEKLKNLPCIENDPVRYLRQTNDGKLIVSINGETGYIIHINLDDLTFLTKGGAFDGEQGQVWCKDGELQFKTTKEGTKKKLTDKGMGEYFNEVQASNPITYGMRDHTYEPENGLIYLLQKRLKELNLYDAEPDGQFGPKTYKAVIAFQKTGKDADGKPLVVDGKVGPKTIQSLGLMD